MALSGVGQGGGEFEDANYRQVGRGRTGVLTRGGTAGQLRRGELAFAPPPQTATIPSKYETVLFAAGAQTAKEGFGSQASRFAGEAVNDNPGPGAYADSMQSTLNRDAPSIGKRGYGNGFASRTQRGGVPGSAPARSQGPGPGSYDVSAYKATGADARAVTRPFAADKGGRALRPDGLNDETSPGPARYKLGRHFDDMAAAREQGYAAPAISGRVDAGGGGTSYRSVFAGKGPRFHNPTPAEQRPGPGAYDVVAPAERAPGGRALPTAAFRSGVSRTAERNGSARPPPREQALGIVPPAPAASQPASAQAAGEGARRDAANASPAFVVGITDRFGRPRERLSRALSVVPGPGAYDLAAAPDRLGKRATFAGAEERAPISSAVFLSATSRQHAADAARAPGPAYYNPRGRALLDKRSFHFNGDKKWTPA